MTATLRMEAVTAAVRESLKVKSPQSVRELVKSTSSRAGVKVYEKEVLGSMWQLVDAGRVEFDFTQNCIRLLD